MRQHQPLAGASEYHIMVADDRAAAQGRKADVSRLARSCVPVPHTLRMLRQLDAAPLRRRLAEQQRRARGRIHLQAVVHLDDFDVVFLAQRRRHFLHEASQKIDAERHVARAHDDCVARRCVDLAQIVRAKACSADDMHSARLRRQRCESHRAGGRGEIDQRIRVQHGLQGIVADGGANGANSGKLSGILPDLRRARALQRPANHGAGRVVDQRHKRAAHAPGGARDDNAHLRHGRLLQSVSARI